ncbi:MAG: redox-sensing transcriptional repressor Rex [Tissierellia bacterium]|nr:redox-sensing transcriptional repressor Rex [Bacillota bacterium]NLL22271.1 redox-sensing transcriptional repressor Rex [Tissierellia bacterium]
MNRSNISMAVIRRLPKYHRCLSDMIDKGIERISSKELSETIGFSASQIRQDFNNFGKFGQQGYGYNVKDLLEAISGIIGLQHTYHLIVLGAGNLGEALVNFGFDKLGFQVDALFDNDPEKIGRIIHGVEVIDINILETYMSKNPVDIAVITTPGKVAQKIADRVAISGARSIWNFAPVDLIVPDDVVVEDVHLVDNLMTLTYLLNE